MPINLTEFERGVPLAGDYHAALTALQDRLAQVQLSQIVYRKRAIVLIEGWEGAGKRAALKRLVAGWDPCQISTHCVSGDDHDEDERHWLAPFWSKLPPAGHTTIFFRSWYSQLVDARMSGRLDDKAWARGTDEINEFESQQRDHGTLLVKLFFHLSAEEQAVRLDELRRDPWRRVLVDDTEAARLGQRAEHERLWQQVFDQTNTRWAPWRIIAAGDKRAGRIAMLAAIADSLEKAMPTKPPAESEVVYLDKQRRA